jgi:rubrerythrin|uniref:Rubrerythrin n=1 Tax=candidate division WOR-3 bacterium TaxID=2052148 RepID=A0A7V3PSK0_UNCW3
MLSDIPKKLKDLDQETLDLEILRAGIIAELDAINLYEQMAALAGNEHIRKVLLDIAREEKAHFGEFEALLLKLDKEQVQESVAGKKEVEELTNS